MAIDQLAKPLVKLDIFRGLTPLQVTEIVRRAYRVVYKPGDLILQEDQESDAAIVVISGDAVRISGPALGQPAEPIPHGSLLAEMAMLIETTSSSTIIARGAVRALRIAREDIHAQMAEDPALADHFVRRITERLSGVLEEMRSIDRLIGESAHLAMPGLAAPIPAELPTPSGFH